MQLAEVHYHLLTLFIGLQLRPQVLTANLHKAKPPPQSMVYNPTRFIHSKCQHRIDILIVIDLLKKKLPQVSLKITLVTSVTDIRGKFHQNKLQF